MLFGAQSLIGAPLADSLTLRIVSANGLPLESVIVHDPSYRIQEVSDADGLCKIFDLAADIDTLVISHFGYETRMIVVDQISLTGVHQIVIEELSDVLDEVVIVGRFDQAQDRDEHVVQNIDAHMIQQTQSRSTADALEQHSDVFVQRSQFGGGSPIIRGFEASRVLLVVDGVRMNNLIYRSGHLQNAITIDPNALHQMEVIFGPGSLLYGSDALGGVVHFRTREPKLRFGDQKKVDGSSMLRFGSAAMALSGNLGLNIGGRKFAYMTSISYSDFGDLTAGKNISSKFPGYGQRPYFAETTPDGDRILTNDKPYRQVGTGYTQFDMIHKFKWQPTKKYASIFNIQYSTSSDIPRYDQLTITNGSPQELRFARWDYGPQNRLLLASRHEIDSDIGWLDKAILIASYQHIDESRINRRIDRPLEITQDEDVSVLSFTADLLKKFSSRTELLYGLELTHNQLGSAAWNTDIVTSLRTPALTRYPDDQASMWNSGLYLNLKHNLGERWSSSLGVRYTHTETQVTYSSSPTISWPQTFLGGIKSAYDNFTGGASVNFSDRGWDLRFLIGTAFRAPNIDDLAKIRIKNGTASVPNVSLKPEEAVNTEITIARRFDPSQSSQMSVTAFYTHLDDAIVQSPHPLPDGQDKLTFDGELFQTVANQNTDRGHLYGISANLLWNLAAAWSVTASWNYTKGTTRDADGRELPMAHIPPIYGRVACAYAFEQWNISAVVRFNGAKPIADYSQNSADNIEYATPEGTLEWITYNLYSTFAPSESLEFQLAVENITDEHYRPFASGVSAPGRNLSLSVRWLF